MSAKTIERTTVHSNPKRNKQHKYKIVFPTDYETMDPTGVTQCGRTTYMELRGPKPADTKCKLCYR